MPGRPTMRATRPGHENRRNKEKPAPRASKTSGSDCLEIADHFECLKLNCKLVKVHGNGVTCIAARARDRDGPLPHPDEVAAVPRAPQAPVAPETADMAGSKGLHGHPLSKGTGGACLVSRSHLPVPAVPSGRAGVLHSPRVQVCTAGVRRRPLKVSPGILHPTILACDLPCSKQMGLSVATLMVIFSYPPIWEQFTPNVEFMSPMVRPGSGLCGHAAACAPARGGGACRRWTMRALCPRRRRPWRPRRGSKTSFPLAV